MLKLSTVCFLVQEEKEVGEFLINIEKDPAQEDFLQGRMMGNPYSSSDPGMCPLMRDIKNKICRDCDLVALLEDDTGMEVSHFLSNLICYVCSFMFKNLVTD